MVSNKNATLVEYSMLLNVMPYTREEVAKAIGMAKSNFLAAIAGRRPLPPPADLALSAFLGLDHAKTLNRNRVHIWEPRSNEALGEALSYFVSPPLSLGPILLDSERTSSPLIPLIDRRGVAIILRLRSPSRKPDFLIPKEHPPLNLPTEQWKRWDAGEISLAEVFDLVLPTKDYWTWERLIEAAQRQGWTAEELATRIGLKV